MKDYLGLAFKCRRKAESLPFKFSDNAETVALLMTADDAINELYYNLEDCRNELCERCGQYKNAHKGACDGCRWKGIDQ